MPALYAHNRFGRKVFEKLDGELYDIISKNYTQFQIGLQGPDIFFFYKAYSSNRVTKYGYQLHVLSAAPFFQHAAEIILKKGRDSCEYAYLLGFLCHFVLDSGCHPYVEQMINETGVGHLEIEEEFEKLLLRKDDKNPFSYPLCELVPTDNLTAKTIYPFYEHMDPVTVKTSLQYLKFIKWFFTAPGFLHRALINLAMKLLKKEDTYKGLMHLRKDNPKCKQSNRGLYKRFQAAIPLAVELIYDYDNTIRTSKVLNPRFHRNFE